jgi:short-subunit dehydrogenase
LRLLEFENLGAEISYHRSDMSSYEDVDRLLTAVHNRFERIDGVFHAAGLANLKYLADLTDDVVQKEFAPKIEGLLNLERGLGEFAVKSGVKPDFVVLFSSTASILGGLGMAAYCAANRFMDAFVHADSERHGIKWICINWDDWDFEYTKEQMAVYEKTGARFAMSPDEGLAALELILSNIESGQILVPTRPLAPRIEQWLHQKTIEDSGEESSGMVPAPASPPSSEGWTEIQKAVVSSYISVLGTNEISLDDDFFSLGGDSLFAGRVLVDLRRRLPQTSEMHVSVILDYPSVRLLADHISEVIDTETGGPMVEETEGLSLEHA